MLVSASRTIQLNKRTISVGRCPSNDLVLSSNLVSKLHAKIYTSDSLLIDLQSRNGTFVNSARVHNEHFKLNNGDILRFGEFPEEFTYQAPNCSATAIF